MPTSDAGSCKNWLLREPSSSTGDVVRYCTVILAKFAVPKCCPVLSSVVAPKVLLLAPAPLSHKSELWLRLWVQLRLRIVLQDNRIRLITDKQIPAYVFFPCGSQPPPPPPVFSLLQVCYIRRYLRYKNLTLASYCVRLNRGRPWVECFFCNLAFQNACSYRPKCGTGQVSLNCFSYIFASLKLTDWANKNKTIRIYIFAYNVTWLMTGMFAIGACTATWLPATCWWRREASPRWQILDWPGPSR